MLSLQTAGIHSEHLANIYGIKYLLIAGRSKLWDTEILQKQLPQHSFQCTRRVIKAQAVIYHLKAGSRGIKHREKYLQRSRILLSVPNRKVGALPEHPVCDASGGAVGAKQDGHNCLLDIIVHRHSRRKGRLL